MARKTAKKTAEHSSAFTEIVESYQNGTYNTAADYLQDVLLPAIDQVALGGDDGSYYHAFCCVLNHWLSQHVIYNTIFGTLSLQ